MGYSPRERGLTCLIIMFFFHLVVFPALAGVNLGETFRTKAKRCIPRVSGGEPASSISSLRSVSYSPRERG